MFDESICIPINLRIYILKLHHSIKTRANLLGTSPAGHVSNTVVICLLGSSTTMIEVSVRKWCRLRLFPLFIKSYLDNSMSLSQYSLIQLTFLNILCIIPKSRINFYPTSSSPRNTERSGKWSRANCTLHSNPRYAFRIV